MKRKKISLLCMVVPAVFLVLISANPVSADYKYFYHDYDEIESILQTLESESDEKNSDVYSLQVFGYSHLGNPMYAVKFSDNPGIEEDDEPDISLDGRTLIMKGIKSGKRG